MSAPRSRRIRVGALARVEGEGGFTVRVKNGRVASAALEIFEPPRFFEAFLRGRRAEEAPDLTARICGICPVAYQMSAVQAVERAWGLEITPAIRALRRLLYCGEWIESHALHITLLHAPDFLGFESGIHLAEKEPEAVRRGLEIKKTGNAIVTTVGGREIHPVNPRVGGFWRAPERAAIAALQGPLERARAAAIETAHWVSGFEFPDLETGHELVALRHPSEYPMAEGTIASTAGLDLAVEEYDSMFVEEQVERSNALHSSIRGRGAYLTGPLARYALNRERLGAPARAAADAAGLGAVCRNPFRSIVVRAVELIEATDAALALVAAYEPPEPPAIAAEPRAGTGWGATEAPRGMLVHGYRLDAAGLIEQAKIVPPTAQNLRAIEEDLTRYVEGHLDLDDRALGWGCEQAVRNHDPCISCATHFLEVRVVRE